MTETTFEFWVCDECHKTYSWKMEAQNEVLVQQRSTHLWGDIMVRNVEKLVICNRCYREYSDRRTR